MFVVCSVLDHNSFSHENVNLFYKCFTSSFHCKTVCVLVGEKLSKVGPTGSHMVLTLTESESHFDLSNSLLPIIYTVCGILQVRILQ